MLFRRGAAVGLACVFASAWVFGTNAAEMQIGTPNLASVARDTHCELDELKAAIEKGATVSDVYDSVGCRGGGLPRSTARDPRMPGVV